MEDIGKILPVDGYYVLQKKSLPVDFDKAMTHLYQPLIGIEAVSLYKTLLHEVDIQQGEAQTHHTLMNYLDLPLNLIYRARLKLEGIGLLKTYQKSHNDHTVFTYELLAPFSPSEFFLDEMLAQLLFHHIGEDKYKLLKKRYVMPHQDQKGENITVLFSEVFQTFHPTNQPVDLTEHSNRNDEIEPHIIDFTWIQKMLEQRMIPTKSILTASNKRLIVQMMQLYDLESHEIEKGIMWALSDENTLHTEEFKNACHDLFKSKNNTATIRLAEKEKSKENKQTKTVPQTQEEHLVQELETISPKQLLEDLSSGNHASEQDMRVIREVMTTQGLPSPVMNVLIHFVLLQSNMKLSKAYLEKIASHWSRANLKTAKEAMVFAKKERNRYQQKSSTNNKSSYTRSYSNEVIPDWFKDRKKNKVKEIPKTNSIDAAKEQAEMEELLKKISSSNKK